MGEVVSFLVILRLGKNGGFIWDSVVGFCGGKIFNS